MKFVGACGYWGARGIVAFLAKVLWGVTIVGKENIPSSGAFILSPVHRDNIDGPLTAIFTWRRMRYLAKEGMFKVRPLALLYTAMGAIKINRGVPDRQSLAKCMAVLEEGLPLVLFPEGARKSGPDVGELQEGAAYLALKAGVPVVPVGIGGSEGAQPKGTRKLKRARVHVIIGAPIDFSSLTTEGRVPRAAIKHASESLRDALQDLFDQAQVKAGKSVPTRS